MDRGTLRVFAFFSLSVGRSALVPRLAISVNSVAGPKLARSAVSTKLPGKRASQQAREKRKKRRAEKRYAEKQRILQELEEFLRTKSGEAETDVITLETDDADTLILHPSEFTEEELNRPTTQLKIHVGRLDRCQWGGADAP